MSDEARISKIESKGLLCAISRLYKDEWSFNNAENEYGKLSGTIKEEHRLLLMAEKIIQKMRC